MTDRFYVRENGCGGYEVKDRRSEGKVVTSSAFYEFADKAASRLMGYRSDGETKEYWFRYYGVK